eukprot:COSAG02_NODE_106_length_36326_cov_13.777266_26_plen_43_part_00
MCSLRSVSRLERGCSLGSDFVSSRVKKNRSSTYAGTLSVKGT